MLVQNSIYLDLAIDLSPLTVESDSLVLEAINLMSQSVDSLDSEQSGDRRLLEVRSSCVLVVNENKLFGVFSKWDVLHLAQKQINLQNLKIVDAISASQIVIKRSQIQDFDSMINLLQQSQCRHLPIIDDFDKIIGVATQESILFAKSKLTEDTLANVEAQKRAVLTAIPDLIYRVRISDIMSR